MVEQLRHAMFWLSLISSIFDSENVQKKLANLAQNHYKQSIFK